MKRKADEAAAAARREQAQNGAFGAAAEGQDSQKFELPDEFKKFMG